MTVPEFAEELENYFTEFLKAEVNTKIFFGGGEFSVEAALKHDPNWKVTNGNFMLYDVKIHFNHNKEDEPTVVYVDFPLIDESSDDLDYSLPEAIEYIKFRLATSRLKKIYDNF